MPNWCEGDLKVRGNIKDLMNFLDKGIYVPRYSFGSYLKSLKASAVDGQPQKLEEDCPDNGLYVIDYDKDKKIPISEFLNEDRDQFYRENDTINVSIKNCEGANIMLTHYPGRAFLMDKDFEFFLPVDDSADILERTDVVIVLPMEFDWDVDQVALAKISKEYNIDFKIYAFERLSEFNRDIEIHKGTVVKDDTIEFDDYEWECPCPNIGG